jgi:hypothetical protein
LQLLLVRHVDELLQADAFVGFAMALHARKIGLTAAAVKQILAHLVHRTLFGVVQAHVHRHAVRLRGDEQRERLKVRTVTAGAANCRACEVFEFEPLQLNHASEETGLKILDLVGVSEIAW